MVVHIFALIIREGGYIEIQVLDKMDHAHGIHILRQHHFYQTHFSLIKWKIAYSYIYIEIRITRTTKICNKNQIV